MTTISHYQLLQQHKNFCSLSLLLGVRPRALIHPPPLQIFNLAILHNYQGERVHTRRLGAYEIARTSPQRY
ncbi:hypothetical protein HanIR_Chr17g0890371 [Helianthus annuus]|nr:hypothetical protein HanIR_Chr17g0890371 [Helianthus annuus]